MATQSYLVPFLLDLVPFLFAHDLHITQQRAASDMHFDKGSQHIGLSWGRTAAKQAFMCSRRELQAAGAQRRARGTGPRISWRQAGQTHATIT